MDSDTQKALEHLEKDSDNHDDDVHITNAPVSTSASTSISNASKRKRSALLDKVSSILSSSYQTVDS